MRALLDRSAYAALLIGVLAQLLFSVNLARPTKPVFDEVHYVPAARTLLALERPANPEHPPLGKELIAGSIAVFGDTPLGWRAAATLAGTATVLGVFAILLLLLGSVRTASYGALLATLNFTVYVHARIAMLEPFLGAFVVGGIAALLWAMRSPPKRVTPRWVLGSLLLGLATAVKWTAAPYVAFAAIGFVALRVRRSDLWAGLTIGKALALLGVVSLAGYFATFLPYFFLREDPLTLAKLLPLQWDMYKLQTQVLQAHPYQSGWLSWPFAIRPIWYLYEPVDGAVRGILYLGNPLVMWGGLVAVAWLGWHWWRTRVPVAGALALLWAASLAIWAAIPKSLGFYYYYHLSGVFLCVAIPAAFHLHAGAKPSRALFWFAVFAGALFIRFLPILSAAALPNDQAFTQWMWLDSWR
ncbi:Dolichyl-phosphate-mannose-protein mannosyltransferase [Sphingomonas guangdongensis]|uniref:Polyprenol-phosphate-mannose--protein mannosyltransferase n=2 Tax=Sphingomonas guangdongensis TaxID=1141890 RepID=A0A285R2K5_9SPHN|nr:Dolichyl-phosphate-mannose-protein mannosyltransferase [Sphingomonas guangdongensis]